MCCLPAFFLQVDSPCCYPHTHMIIHINKESFIPSFKKMSLGLEPLMLGPLPTPVISAITFPRHPGPTSPLSTCSLSKALFCPASVFPPLTYSKQKCQYINTPWNSFQLMIGRSWYINTASPLALRWANSGLYVCPKASPQD